MTEKENWTCLNKLLKSSQQVLTPSFSIHIESSERIDELFKQIQEDYRKFKEAQCGEYSPSVDQEMHAQFQMALLVVSYFAKKNKQILQPTIFLFSDKEFEVYDLLKKFYLLDIYSSTELRQKLISGEKSVESFFKEYMEIKQSMDHLVSQEEIRPGIRQYLKKRGDNYNEKIETAIGKKWGGFIVTTSYAQQSELNFINRIEYKLKSNGNHINFLGIDFTVDKILKGNDCLKRLQKFDSVDKNKFRMMTNLPKNQYIKAELTEKSISWRKRSFIFYAVFASHIEHYFDNGFDSKPLELKEINGYLDSIIRNSGKNKNQILFCIASPTGFENIGRSSSDNKLLNSFISPNVSVCFFDLNKNKKNFNESDEISIELSNLCDIETGEEKHLKLKEILYPEMDHKLLVNQSVSLKYCIEFSTTHECLDLKLVKKIFSQYAQEKQLLIKDIPHTGPVIIRKMG